MVIVLDDLYSERDLLVLNRAQKRASSILDRDPNYDPRSDRLARTILRFFLCGERDFGRLAGMAVKCELDLMKVEKGTNTDELGACPIVREHPKYLH